MHCHLCVHGQSLVGQHVSVSALVTDAPYRLFCCCLSDRFATYVETSSKPSRIVKLEGQDPVQGAANAAEAALQVRQDCLPQFGHTAAHMLALHACPASGPTCYSLLAAALIKSAVSAAASSAGC